MRKTSGKKIWIQVAFKQEIAVYIVQNETVVIFLELSKRGNFLGYQVYSLSLHTPGVVPSSYYLFCKQTFIYSYSSQAS